MPLSRPFGKTLLERTERDPKFRKELLRGALDALLSGEVTLAKTILRDYINATVGFSTLAEATSIPPKSLMRMFGPSGNPRAENLFEVVSFLQHREGVRFKVKAAPTWWIGLRPFTAQGSSNVVGEFDCVDKAEQSGQATRGGSGVTSRGVPASRRVDRKGRVRNFAIDVDNHDQGPRGRPSRLP